MTNQSERVILQNRMVLILFFFIFVRSSFKRLVLVIKQEMKLSLNRLMENPVMEADNVGRVNKVKVTQEERVSKKCH